MKKLRFMVLGLLPVLFSCEKPENSPIILNDYITDLYGNSYFPLDTNDTWIYKKIFCLYDDVIDSIDESYCDTTMDSITPGPGKLIRHIVAKKFGQNYYNTQYNKVSLVIDSNSVFIYTMLSTYYLQS